jgi:hypothetical protein
MSKEKESSTPPSLKGVIIFWLEKVYQFTPLGIKRPVEFILFGISPDIPKNFSNIFKNSNDRQAIIWIWSITFFLVFVVNLFLSASHNTLYGFDPNRLYFLNDWADLIEYFVLCPSQVVVASMLIIIIFRGINDLDLFNKSIQSSNQIKIQPKNSTENYQSFNIPLSIFFSFLISLVTTIIFMKESLDSNNFGKYFWYVEHVTPDGDRILGSFGLYYAFVNFALGFIAAYAVLAYLRIFIIALQIGKSIDNLEISSRLNLTNLKKGVAPFTQSYSWAKGLAFLYYLNWWTWQFFSQPKSSLSAVLYGTALSICGIFIVSIPRYYIQLKWYKLVVRRAKAKNNNSLANDQISFEDIRPNKIVLLTDIIDILFGIMFIYTLMVYIFSNFFK